MTQQAHRSSACTAHRAVVSIDIRTKRRWSNIGARVITYDRPGYGRSDRNPGRRVVDCVPDVEAIADAEGIDHFVVVGGSGGGPHALAVAARLPERVTFVRCVVGIVPYDTADFDWFAGMDPENIKEFGWALEGEETLYRELSKEATAMVARVDGGRRKRARFRLGAGRR